MSKNKSDIQLEVINNTQSQLFPALCKSYEKVFSGPPYFDEFEDGDVERECSKYTGPRETFTVVAVNKITDLVLSFGCCIRTDLAKVAPFLTSQQASIPFELKESVYMAELGTLDESRGNGLGHQMILERLRWAKREGLKYYLMRTSADGGSSDRLYSHIGAQQLPFREIPHGEFATVAPKPRVYWYGRVDAGITALEQILHEWQNEAA